MSTILAVPALGQPFFAERFNAYSDLQGPSRSVHDGQGNVYAYFQPMDVAGPRIAPTPFLLRESDGSAVESFELEQTLQLADAVAVQPDGKVLIAGGLGNDAVVIRALADGRRDPDFSMVKFTQGIRFMTVRNNGKILVAISGRLFAYTSPDAIEVPFPTLYQLNADGTVDESFHRVSLDGGIFVPPVEDSEERIYIAGLFNNVDGTPREGFARLNSDGTHDTAFAASAGVPGGMVSNQVRGIGIQSTGRVVVAGDFRIAGAAPVGAVRFNSDGSFDDSFTRLTISGGMGIVNGLRPRYLVLLPDDRILLCSDRLLRLQPDGALDGSFNVPVFGAETFFFSLGSDGRIFVPGVVDVNGTAVRGIAVFSADGVLDTGFDAGGFGVARYPTEATVLDNGQIVVAGNFNEWNGEPAPGLTLFADETTRLSLPLDPADIAPGLEAVLSASVAKAANGGFYAYLFGFNSSFGITAGLSRVGADGSIDPGFSFTPPSGVTLNTITNLFASPTGELFAIAALRQQAIVDGYSANIIKVTAQGSADPGFTLAESVRANLSSFSRNPSTNEINLGIGLIKIAQILPDGRLLVIVCRLDGTTGLIRLLPTGAVDTSFNPPDFGVNESSTGFTTVFDPQLGRFVQAYATSYTERSIIDAHQMPDGTVYVSGAFTEVSGQPAPGLVRLLEDGSVDPAFALTSGPGLAPGELDIPAIYDIETDAEGNIYLAGRFQVFEGDPVTGLVRLAPDGGFDDQFVPLTGFKTSALGIVEARMIFAGGKLHLFGTAAASDQRFPASFRIIDDFGPAWTVDDDLGLTVATTFTLSWSPVLGWYDREAYPWIYLPNHGWFKVHSGAIDIGLWLYSPDPAIGWAYVIEDYPGSIYFLPLTGQSGWRPI